VVVVCSRDGFFPLFDSAFRVEGWSRVHLIVLNLVQYFDQNNEP
jgi:hypothetical protein